MSHAPTGPSKAPEFVAALKGAGFDFFCGVPCSLLKGLVSLLDGDQDAHYISATREDSALWRVRAPGGEALVRYRIHLPAESRPLRSAWIPFLAPSGGLVGGPHSFMYIVGAELVQVANAIAPEHLSLQVDAPEDLAVLGAHMQVFDL